MKDQVVLERFDFKAQFVKEADCCMTHFEHFNFYPSSSKQPFPPPPQKKQNHTLKNTNTWRAMVDYSKWDKLTKESAGCKRAGCKTGESVEVGFVTDVKKSFPFVTCPSDVPQKCLKLCMTETSGTLSWVGGSSY